MFETIAIAVKDKTLALYFACLIFAASAAASTLPYQSLIAVESLEFDKGTYSTILMLVSALSVVLSVSIGTLSDYLHNKTALMLVAAMAGCIGHTFMAVDFSKVAFIVCHVVFLPIAFLLFQISFTAIRIHTTRLPKKDADTIMASSRTLIAMAYVVVPPGVGLLVGAGVSFAGLYWLGMAAYASCFILVLLAQHSQAKDPNGSIAPSKVTRHSWTSIVFGGNTILVPIIIMCLLEGARKLNGITFPLIVVNEVKGTPSDVGFFAGLTAIIEIPCMLLWSAQIGRFQKTSILGAGALLYSLYLLLLSRAGVLWFVYCLIPLGVLGVSALMSINLAFLQDLVPDRPGLGSSLTSVTGFLGWAIASLAFASTPPAWSYASLALIASGLALLGGVFLLLMSRARRSERATP